MELSRESPSGIKLSFHIVGWLIFFFAPVILSPGRDMLKFATIYPGWYQGRVTHIHVQVYLGSTLKLTSQIALPEDINTEVYNSTLYVAHGQNSTKNSTDNIIQDSLDNELATVVKNDSGSYDLAHTLYISA
jgi:hypothetical protein